MRNTDLDPRPRNMHDPIPLRDRKRPGRRRFPPEEMPVDAALRRPAAERLAEARENWPMFGDDDTL